MALRDFFIKAKPIWEENKQKTQNYTMAFRAIVDRASINRNSRIKIRLGAQCVYKLFINGKFISFGPARMAHGFWCADEIDVTDKLTEDKNVFSILVGGFYCYSYSYLRQDSFLCAEIVDDRGEVYAATGISGFEGYFYEEKKIKVQRYSWQRPFSEVYFLGEEKLLSSLSVTRAPVILSCEDEKGFYKLRVPDCDYEELIPEKIIERGSAAFNEKKQVKDDFFEYLSNKLKEFPGAEMGFTDEEAEYLPLYDGLKLDFSVESKVEEPSSTVRLNDSYAVYSFCKNATGMFCLDADVKKNSVLYLMFDEILVKGEVNFTRMNCVNVVEWHLKPGKYHLETLEPYTAKYVKLATIGDLTVENFVIREVAFPQKKITNKIDIPDEKLRKIYDAAVNSFRSSCFDLYMDCPSRERAPWLCDGFFMSRVENVLTGKNEIARNYLFNFILPDKFEFLPEGMIPMIYPAEHVDGCYIPNYAMWFVLQIKDYFEMSGDRTIVDAARDKIYKILSFFRGYENKEKLLEKLDKWVFVEWSEANRLVQDINYPTNMLYAAFKDAIAALYADENLKKEAKELRIEIRRQSLKGKFFCDNAVYGEDGKAILSDKCTEVCQYYAFYFGIASPETDPELWKTLLDDFGPKRKESGKYPEIFQANAFIGNYMRLDLLCQYGYFDKATEEISDYFYYMAERTATLWEYADENASCSHGFASYVVYWLNKIFNGKNEMRNGKICF